MDLSLDFMRVGPRTKELLKEFWTIAEPKLPEILERFYQHIDTQPELARLVSGKVPGLISAQTEHWKRLFTSGFDDAYIASVRQIGETHHRIGLEPQWYIGGYNFIKQELSRLAVTEFAGDPEKLAEMLAAIDSAVMPGMQGGPLMHNIAGRAVGFAEALEPAFADYAADVVSNAKALGAALGEHGLSLVSGGTDTHLVLVDLRESHPDVTGKDAERALEEVGIVLNANTVPGETRSPFVASGIRAGTPALTTRGFEEAEMRTVADCIARVIDNVDDEGVKAEVAETVTGLCDAHPIYE
jgi:truncated hemoglobin YjbI